jgi:hypothetical protein
MFVLITGPQAVGKMTVGQNLSEVLGFPLFHNHMTIELLLSLFDYGESRDLNYLFREEIFKKMASLKDKKGWIFTYVWDFDDSKEWHYIRHLKEIFVHHDFLIVELYSDLGTRLLRNKTPHRLLHKKSKRDVESSEFRLIETVKHHRTTSHPQEVLKQFPY